ncbi:transposase [Pleurocapsales cyanobacterium LEGE 06147]|nr:transposase [Pleurocapsales cyanobacterium LEGE 06147]
MRTLRSINRFFPSSKACNHCLNVIDSLPLDLRRWDCPSCGTKNINRDINASKNIRDKGLRILFSSGTGKTVNGSSVRQRRGRKSRIVATADEVGSCSYNL